MVVPSTHAAALALLALSTVSLGLWPSTLKAAGERWRFELYYLDFIAGALGASVLAAFTLGTFGTELPFGDRLLIAGRTSQVVTIGAGFVFNLANMLFLAAVPILGISGAILTCGSMALLVVTAMSFSSGKPLLLLVSALLLVLAFVFNLVACRWRTQVPPRPKRPVQSPLRKPPVEVPLVTRGLIVSVVGGLVLGFSLPLGVRGIAGEFGVGPFAGALLFAIGAILSTAVFSMYFLNISVSGPPLSLRAYTRGRSRQHLCGWLGGVLWLVGMLAVFLATAAPSQASISPELSFGLPVASFLLTALSGLLLWREFKGAPSKARQLVALAFVALAAAIGVLSSARTD